MKIDIKYGNNGKGVEAEKDAFTKISIFSEEESLADDETVIHATKTLTKKSKNIIKRYIKKCTVGMEASHFLNPYSMWYKESESASFDKRSGRNVYEYCEVDENCFQLYLKFLNTKNVVYLRHAEREHSNG